MASWVAGILHTAAAQLVLPEQSAAAHHLRYLLDQTTPAASQTAKPIAGAETMMVKLEMDQPLPP
jgi:hypothetical protein